MKCIGIISAAAVSAAILSGCSTPMMSADQLAAYHKPTLTLNCDTGCTATYTDPRDRPRQPTNRNDVILGVTSTVTGALTSIAPWAAVSMTAAEGIKRATGADNSVRDNSTHDNRSWDYTHEPVIVNQPEPIIVRPPTEE